MPVASNADLIVGCMNDVVRIISDTFHGTVDPLTDSNMHALAQTTSLLLHNAEASRIAPAPAPQLRVPAAPAPAPQMRVPALPTVPELRVLLETYHNRSKPLHQHEPRLASTSLRRSPRNHDPIEQANLAAPSAMEPYHEHKDDCNNPRQLPTYSALSTIKQTTTHQKNVQFAMNIERPGSPTSVDQHPSFQLDEDTAILLFEDYAQGRIQRAANKAINPDTGQAAEYKELSKSSAGPRWIGEHGSEIGRLAQGHKEVQGTNTMFFTPVTQLPPGRKATYYRPVCADRPNKENPIRVRGTVGGNLINYPHDVSTKSAGLITAKIMLNSVISTPDAKCLVIYLKDFYLNNDMERYEYM